MPTFRVGNSRIKNMDKEKIIITRKSIGFTKRMEEMVEKIQADRGLMTFSDAVHFAIAELYKKDNPAYMALKVNETPEERVQRREQEKKAKEELFRQDQLAILEKLGGELIEREGGEVATYYTYTGKKRFQQVVPISMLSTDFLKTQYQPSREKVEELQRKGEVDY